MFTNVFAFAETATRSRRGVHLSSLVDRTSRGIGARSFFGRKIRRAERGRRAGVIIGGWSIKLEPRDGQCKLAPDLEPSPFYTKPSRPCAKDDDAVEKYNILRTCNPPLDIASHRAAAAAAAAAIAASASASAAASAAGLAYQPSGESILENRSLVAKRRLRSRLRRHSRRPHARRK